MKYTGTKKRGKIKNKKRLTRGGIISGLLYIAGIIVILVLLGTALIGGSRVKLKDLSSPSENPYSCCDSGDGDECYPLTERRIIYKGMEYGLLKSNIYQGESNHIEPTDSFTPDGNRIFINTSDHTAHYPDKKGCEPGHDLISIDSKFTGRDSNCFGIPNDQIIYVCRDTPEVCSNILNIGSEPFDAYFRLADGRVPYEIANYCPKPKTKSTPPPQKIVGLPTPSGTANLQLETFTITQEKTKYKWLGAWCKPADYFYPTEKTTISFDVKPQGEFVYTDPQYTKGGWNFTAYPDGRIVHQGKQYPYIYWDAAIPNNLINEPKTGYSVRYDELDKFLTKLLPQMGLNAKETSEFREYWLTQLPYSNYYFVGAIPQEQINKLAPITVNPKPDSVLRVSLFFKPLKENINVSAPVITPFERNGFTVVEWGGLFDTQKHPGFSCLM